MQHQCDRPNTKRALRSCCVPPAHLLRTEAFPHTATPRATRFSRPHTMLGTAVSVTSVSALALGPGQLGATALLAFAQAIAAALLMNISIVGINQARWRVLRLAAALGTCSAASA